MLKPLAVRRVSADSRGPPRAEASAWLASGAMANRVGLGSAGSSSKLERSAVWVGFAARLTTAAGAGAAFTVDGATTWLTKASSRQNTQMLELIRMSRTKHTHGIQILPFGWSAWDLVHSIELADLLFKPIDATTQFVQFLLAGHTKILQQVVAVAFQIPFRLFLKFGGFTPQSA